MSTFPTMDELSHKSRTADAPPGEESLNHREFMQNSVGKCSRLLKPLFEIELVK